MKSFPFFKLALTLCLVSSLDFLSVNMSERDFDNLLKSGPLDGFMTAEQFWKIYEEFKEDDMNSLYLSNKVVIGHSYEKRPMEGFYICDNTSQLGRYVKTKNIILFTSVHHPREPVSLTMVVLMIREILKMIKAAGHNKMKEVFRDNILFILPIMNIDSYIYINKNYFGVNQKQIRMIRKNRHLTPNCVDWLGGVDLNRNYDMRFGQDEDGSSSDPCREDYRGTSPFSEPETASLRNYVDSHPNIVSDVNIHTYGNAWIYPYNFVHDKTNHLLMTKNRLFYDFYNEFTNEVVHKNIKALFGNAAFTLDYSTNGEAGDWFTGKKHILNIDVELGNNDPRSEEFYPPRTIIADIVRYNWLAMKEFFFKHAVEFSHRIVLYKSQVNFEIINRAISALMNASLEIQPVFHGQVSPSRYRVFYCIKNLTTDLCGGAKPFSSPLQLTIPGRHILEIQLKFDNSADSDRIEGLRMGIKRDATYLNYRDQSYFFKRKN